MPMTRCQACEVRLCCKEFLTTYGPDPDPAFVAYTTCFRACMDNECRDRCVSDNQAGIMVLRALRRCDDTNCAKPCSVIGDIEEAQEPR